MMTVFKRPLFSVGCILYLTLAAACFLGFNAAFVILLVTAFLFISAVILYKKIPAVYTVATITICIGLLSFCLSEKMLKQPIEALDSVTANITGAVEQLPDTTGGIGGYVVKITSVDLQNAPKNFKLLVMGTLTENLSLGDEISVQVEFHTFTNTFTFDTATYYISKGIYSYAYITQTPEIVSSYKNPVKAFLNKVNSAASAAVYKILPNSYGDIVNAMVLGNKSNLSEEITDSFKVAGLSHVLVVSGLHLSILMAALLGLFSAFKMNKRLAYILTAIVLVLYAAFLGFTPSVTRAVIMSVLYCIAKAIGQESDSLNSLGFSVVVLLVISPYSIYDTGLNLSVFATVGIIVLAKPCQNMLFNKLNKKPKIQKLLKLPVSALSVTGSAVLFTLPISVFLLGSVSLAAPLSNIIAAPFISLLTVGAFVLTGVASIPFLLPIAKLLGLFCGLLAKILSKIAALCAAIPFAQVSADYGFVYIWLFCVIALWLMVYFCYRKVNLIKYAAVFSAILLFAGILSYQLLNKGVIEITNLKADDGNCALIIDGSKAVVLSASQGNYAGYEIDSYLKSKGVKEIELLVLPDCGEQNGEGITALSQKSIINRLIYQASGKYIEQVERAIVSCKNADLLQDSVISFGENMALEIYSQTNGCVMFFSYDNTTALFSLGNIDLNLVPLEKTAVDLFVVINGTPQNYNRIKCSFAAVNSIEENYLLAKNLSVLNTDVAGTDFLQKLTYRTRGNGFISKND